MRIKQQLTRQIAVALLIFLLANTPNAVAQGQESSPAVVRLVPAELQVVTGQTAEVAVEIMGVDGLYGIDLTIVYDPSMIEVVDMDTGLNGVQMQMGLFLDPGFVVGNLADNVKGIAQFAMTQLTPSEAKSGEGTLLILRLRGLKTGDATPLTLVNAELANRSGVTLPSTVKNGSIEVIAVASTMSTATSIPSQGAGTPLPTSTPRPTEAATTTSHPTSTSFPTATISAQTSGTTPGATRVLVAQTTAPSATATPIDPSPTTKSVGPSRTSTPADRAADVAATSEPTPIGDTPTVSVSLADTAMPTIVSNMSTVDAGNETQNANSQGETQTRDDRTLLTAGIALLALAAILGIALGIAWRHNTHTHNSDGLG